MIIEAKLEVRESTSWETLDKAISRLGGATAAAVESTAKAAAQSIISPDAESDDEDGLGTVLAILKPRPAQSFRRSCIYLGIKPFMASRNGSSRASVKGKAWLYLQPTAGKSTLWSCANTLVWALVIGISVQFSVFDCMADFAM